MGNILAKKIISDDENFYSDLTTDIMCVKSDIKITKKILPKYNTDYCKCKKCMEILQYDYENEV